MYLLASGVFSERARVHEESSLAAWLSERYALPRASGIAPAAPPTYLSIGSNAHTVPRRHLVFSLASRSIPWM